MSNEHVREIVELVALRAFLKGTTRKVFELSPEERESALHGVGVQDACMEIEMVMRVAAHTRSAVETGGVHIVEVQGA